MSSHPLETLRYIARSWEIGDEPPVKEAAAVLAELAARAPSTLLHACRRLIEYFPASGPVWWLSARALSAPDPVEGIWEAVHELAQDDAPGQLADALPPASIVALPRPYEDLVARRRADVTVVGKASRAQILVVKVLAASSGNMLVASHVASLAESSARGGREVWAVVERGAVLPGPLWSELAARTAPLEAVRVLALEAVDACVSGSGKMLPARALAQPTCPPVAELLGWQS